MADPKYSKPPEPCGSCRFRSEYGIWYCNYSDIMGVTKHRMHPAQEAQEARWEAMRLMYLQGGNDVQIAEELGCATGTVRHWRHRQCLPPNGRDGWNK